MFAWCYGQAGGWAGWIAMTITMVMLAALATLTGVMVWRRSRARRRALEARDPVADLAARFARGEIDERAYLEGRDARTPFVH